MTRSQAVALLGRPTKIQRNGYVYDFPYDRPLTTEERERYKNATPRVTAVGVTDKIEFTFAGSKANVIDVMYSETY